MVSLEVIRKYHIASYICKYQIIIFLPRNELWDTMVLLYNKKAKKKNAFNYYKQ